MRRRETASAPWIGLAASAPRRPSWRRSMAQLTGPAPRRALARARNVRAQRSLRFALLPAPGLLQRIHHLARHIALVMLGENRIGLKQPIGADFAFDHDALPFAEQVR